MTVPAVTPNRCANTHRSTPSPRSRRISRRSTSVKRRTRSGNPRDSR